MSSNAKSEKTQNQNVTVTLADVAPERSIVMKDGQQWVVVGHQGSTLIKGRRWNGREYVTSLLSANGLKVLSRAKRVQPQDTAVGQALLAAQAKAEAERRARKAAAKAKKAAARAR